MTLKYLEITIRQGCATISKDMLPESITHRYQRFIGTYAAKEKLYILSKFSRNININCM